MVVVSLGEESAAEVLRSTSKAKKVVQVEESKKVPAEDTTKVAAATTKGSKQPEKAAVKASPRRRTSDKEELKPSASKRSGSAKKEAVPKEPKAKAPELGPAAKAPEPKKSKETGDKKPKAGKENKEVLQLGKLDNMQLQVRPRWEAIDGTDGMKQMRAALYELSNAFETRNEAAAMQAMTQILHNPQGLQSLRSLPGMDAETANFLEQASGVLAAAQKQFPLDTMPAMMDYDAPLSAIRFPEEADRTMVANDWKQISARSKAVKKNTGKKPEDSQVTATTKPAGSKNKLFSWSSKNTKEKDAKTSAGSAPEETAEDKDKEPPTERGAAVMDFTELVTMNAGIINANMPLIQILLQLFEQLLAPAVNSDEGGLDTACDVAALRLFREISGKIVLKDFQTSILASARALLPDSWDSKHESAWMAVWSCIAERLEKSLPLPAKYERPVRDFITGLSPEQRQKLGKRSFERLFNECEPVSHHFNQSWQRLSFIIGKTLDMAVRLFKEPALMYNELTQLGLKHIMFQANSQYFQPWVAALVAEIQLICQDEKVIEGTNFALCVIGSVIAQALEAGATPILKAIVTDDTQALKKALAVTPRGQRAEAILGSG